MGRSKRWGLRSTILLLGVLGALWGWNAWRQKVLADNDCFAARARFILVGAQQQNLQRQYARGEVPKPWTQDVAGLYALGLIDRSLAEADDRPVKPLTPKPVPINGYLVRFLPV